MKRYIKAAFAIAIALFALTSCDNVYYSAVSGSVHDASGNGIAGVNVYAYTSESERDKIYESYEYGMDFNDPNCLFRATTAANGDFSIGRVVWTTSSSEWGEDYASTTLYFIFFSKDYGIAKYDGVNIISGSANASSVTIDMGNPIRTDCTLTLRFKDASDRSATSRQNVSNIVSFTYSYNDGYGVVRTNTSSTSEGIAALPIKMLNDDASSTGSVNVTISNIKQADGYWAPRNQKTEIEDSSAEYTFTVESQNETGDILMKRKKWDLGTGISGTVAAETKDDKTLGYSLSDATVTGKITLAEGSIPEQTVSVSSTETPGIEGAVTITGSYSGLLSNVVTDVEYSNEGKATEAPVPLTATVTLTLPDGIADPIEKEETIDMVTGRFNNVSFYVTRAEQQGTAV